jgi:hypothetical protein
MTAEPGPAPARIGLGRSNAVVTICVLIFLVVIVGASVKGGIGSTGSTRYLSFFIAVLFAIPLLLAIRALPKLLAPRWVIVDRAGLAIQHGKKTVVVGWPDILAVGIGYALAEPEKTKIPVSIDGATELVAEKLSGLAAEALQISGKRQIALEIYPARPDAVNAYPRLRPYWKPQPPPAPTLPGMQWHFPLPPVAGIAEQVAAALYAWSPPRWAGWTPRPWVGKK